MRQYYSSIVASDLSASSADLETLSVPFAGKIRLDESYVRFGQVVGAATTFATCTVSVGGTARGTLTTSAASSAIGDTQALGAVSSGNEYINFAAGDDIVMAHVQATGGTTTGTAYFHLSLEYAH